MSQPSCPQCHALQARRVEQRGFLQKTILRRLGFFPWECRFCKASFKLRNRGPQRRAESTAADPAT